MAESDGYSPPFDIPFEASSDEEGTVAAYFPDDFKQYVDTQLNCCPVVYDGKGPVKGLCGYRMISKHYKFYMDRESSDEQLGVPGRFQPSKEFVLYDYYDWLLMLKEVGLESSISHADHVKERNVRQSDALYEISKVLEVVCEVHGLDFAQVWARCRVNYACWALGKSDFFHVICHVNKDDEDFNLASNAQHLRKGQGVVGRAFSSPNVLFCKDITQLSIIDYPFAHYARYHKLGCCFTICLQSSIIRNDIYVLECFMPPSNNKNGNQQTALRKILETMKKNFRTFKLASGEEVGEHLCIDEISFQNEIMVYRGGHHARIWLVALNLVNLLRVLIINKYHN
ncbi:hypothetical protein TEA_014618 [Camellia sinensis var. sinensis]|uniref:NLP1-9 GAF domain-containing protein n=1 Tax=Camellia sinensis var. sinensis TaxID=542762 RepID=A0A4S4E2L2_CAMSN|nr:hypothetical protein TEA_014618 [Camellia sinensis var. sinensis]